MDPRGSSTLRLGTEYPVTRRWEDTKLAVEKRGVGIVVRNCLLSPAGTFHYQTVHFKRKES